jgi:UDP-2-acetamido-3-amino-2,3-dideoxy-glucuronate N-acetyltransferase
MAINCQAGVSIHPSVRLGGTLDVGFNSCVGYGEPEDEVTYIGDRVRIGAFCIIEHGVHIEDDVEIDHYCRISRGVRIGAGTRILYRAQLFDDVEVGQNCIVAGELVDRTRLGDNVTFQGNTAHTHNDPTGDWDEVEEPSPTIESGSVVGIGALVIGGVTIGPCAYVAAGEIVSCDVPTESVLKGGKLQPLSNFRGLIKVRC